MFFFFGILIFSTFLVILRMLSFFSCFSHVGNPRLVPLVLVLQSNSAGGRQATGAPRASLVALSELYGSWSKGVLVFRLLFFCMFCAWRVLTYLIKDLRGAFLVIFNVWPLLERPNIFGWFSRFLKAKGFDGSGWESGLAKGADRQSEGFVHSGCCFDLRGARRSWCCVYFWWFLATLNLFKAPFGEYMWFLLGFWSKSQEETIYSKSLFRCQRDLKRRM